MLSVKASLIDDAKLLAVNETGDAFEEAMGVIVPPRHKIKPEKE